GGARRCARRGVVRIVECAGVHPDLAAFRNRAPYWLDLRLAVAGFPGGEEPYATLEQNAAVARSFVSDNLTKLRHIAPDLGPDQPAPALDFSRFEAQIAQIERVRCAPAPIDLHAPIWHRSTPPGLAPLLRARPTLAKPLIAEILAQSFAHRNWRSIDVNEVFKASTKETRENDDFRGPIEPAPGHPSQAAGRFGSIWFEAFARAEAEAPGYWPHGAGYWWLSVVDWANRRDQRVLLQDFSLAAGRPWGVGAERPEGYERASLFRAEAEMRKRRRLLDAVNYALHHGFEIDALALQFHLDPARIIDETDFTAFLRSIVSMGLDVEVTELDVALAGGPVRTRNNSAEAERFAVRYAERLLDLLLRETPIRVIGGWTGWTGPEEDAARMPLIDEDGVTALGEAVIDAARRAAPPERRRPAPISRRYSLLGGLGPEIWRAARDPQAGGFRLEGKFDGAMARPGSGGASLTLIPRSDQPSRIPPLWAAPGGAARPYDPSAMALAFQWREIDGRGGPRLQLRRDGAVIAEILRKGETILVAAGGRARPLGPATHRGFHRAALSWEEGRLSVAATTEAGLRRQTGLALEAAPDEVLLLGDGVSETIARATLLEVFRDPMEPARLARASRLEGAATPSVAEILAGAVETGDAAAPEPRWAARGGAEAFDESAPAASGGER
ncbi:MAG: endo-1,4-beta-xylanase, partial [Pseudomonadota bacterium]